MPTLVTFSDLNHAIRLAWSQADRRPSWPARVSLPTSKPLANRSRGITSASFECLRPHLAQLGVATDLELTRLSGVSRSLIACVRLVLGIPRSQPPAMSPTIRRDCLRRLRARESVTAISRTTGEPVSRVRALARSIGWEYSWVSRKGDGATKTIGRLPKDKLDHLLAQGLSLTAVAKRAGVSHQRVAQVVKAMGLPSQQVRMRPWRKKATLAKERWLQVRRERWLKDRARRRAARMPKLRHFLSRANRLYGEGLSIGQIAKRYRIPPNSMSWWIFRGRRELGWFPKRR